MHDLQELIHDIIELSCVALAYLIYNITMNQVVGVVTLLLLFIKIGNELRVRQKLKREEQSNNLSKTENK
jgi:hypothetical protein